MLLGLSSICLKSFVQVSVRMVYLCVDVCAVAGTVFVWVGSNTRFDVWLEKTFFCKYQINRYLELFGIGLA